MNANIIAAFVLVTILHLSSGLFFGPVQNSCRLDRDCPATSASRIGGRCKEIRWTTVESIICDFRNFFKSRRNKINCTYRACVECFNDVDCNGNLVCYGKCITRQQRRQREQQQAAAAYVISQQ